MVLTRVFTGILPLAVVGLCATAGVDYFAQSRQAAAQGRELSVSDYLTASMERMRGAFASMSGTEDAGTIPAPPSTPAATDAQANAMLAAADAELARLGLVEGAEPAPGMLTMIMGLLQGGDGRALEVALDDVETQEARQGTAVVIRRAGQVATE